MPDLKNIFTNASTGNIMGAIAGYFISNFMGGGLTANFAAAAAGWAAGPTLMEKITKGDFGAVFKHFAPSSGPTP